MVENRVQITIPDVGTTSAIIAAAEPSGPTRPGLVLAHGAGNDMDNVLLVYVAQQLARRGHPVMRFNFLYKEQGRKAPDRAPLLASTWLAAWRFAADRPEFHGLPLVAAGKSMGGRIASQLIAEREMTADGLLLLGYPLHPAGKKDRLRDRHLPDIAVPMLWFAGTRDSLCDLNLLRAVLGKLDRPVDLEVIEDGDHSFKVRKCSGLDQEEVYRHIVDSSARWLDRVGMEI